MWIFPVLHGLLWPWLRAQVRKYKTPSEKELKHINRKLKSCWGHGSHDEYFLYPFVEFPAGPSYPAPLHQKMFGRKFHVVYLFWFALQEQEAREEIKAQVQKELT